MFIRGQPFRFGMALLANGRNGNDLGIGRPQSAVPMASINNSSVAASRRPAITWVPEGRVTPGALTIGASDPFEAKRRPRTWKASA